VDKRGVIEELEGLRDNTHTLDNLKLLAAINLEGMKEAVLNSRTAEDTYERKKEYDGAAKFWRDIIRDIRNEKVENKSNMRQTRRG